MIMPGRLELLVPAVESDEETCVSPGTASGSGKLNSHAANVNTDVSIRATRHKVKISFFIVKTLLFIKVES